MKYTDQSKINLLIIVNSDAYCDMTALFPATKYFLRRKNVNKLAILDMKHNPLLFRDIDERALKYMNVCYPDSNYSYDNYSDYPLHKASCKDFNCGWFRMDAPTGYDLKPLFSLLQKKSNIPFFNSLEGMLEYGSKAKLNELQDVLISSEGHRYIPQSIVASNVDDINDFQNKVQKDVVVKSFYGCGGKEVYRRNLDGTGDMVDAQEMQRFIEQAGGQVCVQEFVRMERIIDDRVIVMFDPESQEMRARCIVRRVAQEGQWKANLSLGAMAEFEEVDERHCEMAQLLSDLLIENGIFFAGIDVLYDGDSLDCEGRCLPRITEINVRNVGGITEASRLSQRNYTKEFVDEHYDIFLNSIKRFSRMSAFTQTITDVRALENIVCARE